MVDVIEDISSGQQVLINYGSRSDDNLLLNYGFIMPPTSPNSMTRLRFTTEEFETAFTKHMSVTAEQYWQQLGTGLIQVKSQSINFTIRYRVGHYQTFLFRVTLFVC